MEPKALTVIESFSERLAAASATKVSRSRFLRRTGGLAAAIAFSGALLELNVKSAFAHGACNTHPCGPSPLCPSGSDCFQNDCSGSCSGRYYNTFTCGAPIGENSWCETCSSGSWTGYWICGDCCCPDGTGTPCNGCTSKKACICRYEKSGIGSCRSGCCCDCGTGGSCSC
jgi:hypothetical protein